MNLSWLLDNSKKQMEEKSVPKLSEAVLFVIMREKMLQIILRNFTRYNGLGLKCDHTELHFTYKFNHIHTSIFDVEDLTDFYHD
ncbi:hypothetical protein RUM43_012687 [Polyplax serrata]|uniref:Uncharacterized protein n=1 Tax=Polyplax serrata TaxID=468196 RepID=A0AAN8PT66_POLSC